MSHDGRKLSTEIMRIGTHKIYGSVLGVNYINVYVISTHCLHYANHILTYLPDKRLIKPFEYYQ